MTIMVLFLASTVAMSTYPFDPRQALSAILIALFVIVGAVIVKVYADMHRDATLSHVTNTKPGELGYGILVQDHWIWFCSPGWTADKGVSGYNGFYFLMAAARDFVSQID